MLRFLITLLYPQYTNTHHTTVRYAFSFVFLAFLVAGFAAVITNEGSYVTFKVSDTEVAMQQEFTIDVIAFAHVPVNAIDITLTYGEDDLVIESIDTGTSVITLWTEPPYARDGKIYLRGGTFRKGFVGEHTIARIRAHAETSGEARIVLSDTQFVAGDGKGTNVDVSPLDTDSVKISVSGDDGLLSASAEVAVVTDMDGDNDVDLADIAKFMTAWFSRSNTHDFDGDGRMTFKDFSIILASSFFH